MPNESYVGVLTFLIVFFGIQVFLRVDFSAAAKDSSNDGTRESRSIASDKNLASSSSSRNINNGHKQFETKSASDGSASNPGQKSSPSSQVGASDGKVNSPTTYDNSGNKEEENPGSGPSSNDSPPTKDMNPDVVLARRNYKTNTETSDKNDTTATEDSDDADDDYTNTSNTWRCACEGGFLPPGMFGGAEAVFRLGSGECFHKKAV